MKIHELAWDEHMKNIGRMRAKHYDRRAIARYIADINQILAAIDASPTTAGKASPWGRYSNAHSCGPTKYGYRVWFLPNHRGQAVIMAIVHGKRRPGFGSDRDPLWN